MIHRSRFVLLTTVLLAIAMVIGACAAPKATPTPVPPAASPTAQATAEPTAEPTAEVTAEPTAEVTAEPTAEPTEVPTALASQSVVTSPSPVITEAPTPSPSPVPTEPPTPSPVITEAPTPSPVLSVAPSLVPSVAPSIAPSLVPSVVPSMAPSLVPSIVPSVAPSVPPVANDELARITDSGIIRVSIEPNYAPYSVQNPDGSFQGFNVDVATEIARRLGVAVQFEIPSFDLVVAGGWNDRWDMSVGSVTITEARKDVLDFTRPYAFNPAQFAATTASGITTVDGFAGQVICVGAATTYQQWLEGTLVLVDAPPPATPPTGATAFPLETDQLCAQNVQSGRADFTGWLSSADTVEDAIKNGTPMVLVGDPVFFESLGVAFDNTVEDNDTLVAAVDAIIGSMRDDGTLLTLSEKWFNGKDRVSGQ